MTARLSKLVDAALGPLPSVNDFVDFLHRCQRGTGDVPAPNPVHGTLLQGVNAKPPGSAIPHVLPLGWRSTRTPKEKQ